MAICGASQGKVNVDQMGLLIWGGVPQCGRSLDNDSVTPPLPRLTTVSKAKKAVFSPLFSSVPFIYITLVVEILPPLVPVL